MNKTIADNKPWKQPNPWHFQQKLRGGRVHKNRKKVLPRKEKYKKNYD